MISPNGIKSILFDLDGTLRHHVPSGGEVFTEYVVGLGIPIGEEARRRAARWEHFYFANSLEIQSDTKKYGNDERGFWVNFGRRRLRAMGCSPAQAEALAPQASAHMRESYKPEVWIPPELRALLPSWKDAGFVLGVVSNRDEPYAHVLEEMGLDAHFEFSLAGGEVNSFKPDPGIFLEALKRAGTSAYETMYVGDNYFADVVGSLRAGLRPVLYDPNGLFPDAACSVIRSFEQLPKLLS
ncbi:MAG: HAD family hydrolase [Chloroflexota bacterium]